MAVRRVLRACAAAFALLAGGVAPAALAIPDEVGIVDANLRACINDELGQAADSPITAAQAAEMSGELECRQELDIVSLSGMEAFTGIRELDLFDHEIADVSPSVAS